MYLENNKKTALTIYGKNCPYIKIRWEDGYIFISNAVVSLIGNPAFIRLRWNAAKHTLIVEPTNSSDPDGLSVTDWQEQYGLLLYSDMLVDEIWSEDWNKEFSFRIVARYNVPSNIAIFDMKSAVLLEFAKEVLC